VKVKLVISEIFVIIPSFNDNTQTEFCKVHLEHFNALVHLVLRIFVPAALHVHQRCADCGRVSPRIQIRRIFLRMRTEADLVP